MLALSPLGEREFRLLFLGRAVSLFGSAFAPIALAFAVLDLTGSATDLGLVVAAGFVPQIFFILVGGIRGRPAAASPACFVSARAWVERFGDLAGFLVFLDHPIAVGLFNDRLGFGKIVTDSDDEAPCVRPNCLVLRQRDLDAQSAVEVGALAHEFVDLLDRQGLPSSLIADPLVDFAIEGLVLAQAPFAVVHVARAEQPSIPASILDAMEDTCSAIRERLAELRTRPKPT